MKSINARDRHTTTGEPQRQNNADADGRGRHAKHGLAYYIQQARDRATREVPLDEILEAHDRGLEPRDVWGGRDE